MVGSYLSVYIVKWDGHSSKAYRIEKLFSIQGNNVGFTNAKCDPTGRLYFGEVNVNVCDPDQPFSSALYSYDKYEGLQERVSGLKASNGLAWSVKGNYVYHIETCFYNIRQFRWNPHTGELCKQQIFWKQKLDYFI